MYSKCIPNPEKKEKRRVPRRRPQHSSTAAVAIVEIAEVAAGEPASPFMRIKICSAYGHPRRSLVLFYSQSVNEQSFAATHFKATLHMRSGISSVRRSAQRTVLAPHSQITSPFAIFFGRTSEGKASNHAQLPKVYVGTAKQIVIVVG